MYLRRMFLKLRHEIFRYRFGKKLKNSTGELDPTVVLGYLHLIDVKLYVDYKPSNGLHLMLSTGYSNVEELASSIRKANLALSKGTHLFHLKLFTAVKERSLDSFLATMNNYSVTPVEAIVELQQHAVKLLMTVISLKKEEHKMAPYYGRQLQIILNDVVAITGALLAVALVNERKIT